MDNKKKSAILSGILFVSMISGCTKKNDSIAQIEEESNPVVREEHANYDVNDIIDLDRNRSVTFQENKKDTDTEEPLEKETSDDISLWTSKSDYFGYYNVDLENMLKFYYGKSDEFINDAVVQNVLNKLKSLGSGIYYGKYTSKISSFEKGLKLYFEPGNNEYILINPSDHIIHFSFNSLEDYTHESHTIYDFGGEVIDYSKYSIDYSTKDTRMYFIHKINDDDENKPSFEIVRFCDKDYKNLIDIALDFYGKDDYYTISICNPQGKVSISLSREEALAIRELYTSYLPRKDFYGFINDNYELFYKLINLAKYDCSEELYTSLINSLNDIVNERTLTDNKTM